MIAKVYRMLSPGLRARLAGLILLNIFASATDSLGIGAIFVALKAIVDPTQLAALPFARLFLGDAASGPPGAILVTGAIILIFLSRTLAQLIIAWWSQTIRIGTQLRLSSTLMRGYLERPYVFHKRLHSASAFNNIWLKVSQVAQNYLLGVTELVSAGCLFAAILGMLLYLQPHATLPAMAGLGIVALGYWLALRAPLRRWGQAWTERGKDVMRCIGEAMSGIKTVKTTGSESYFERRFIEAARDYLIAAQRYYFAQQMPRPVLEFILILALLAWGGVAARESDPSQLIPTVTLFGFAAYRLLPAALRAMGALQSMGFAATSVAEVYADFTDLAARPKRPRLPPSERVSLRDRILVDGVTLSYDSRERPALDRVTLSIERGEAVAFVGASGAGKSSLADVILGLIEPSSGRILVDGQPLAAGAARSPGLFGYVPQDTFILDDTVRRNVAFGRPDPSIDDEQVRRAVAASALSEVVARLPDGLETQLGERGARLSGGERQRLGLARALYEDPAILILDEPTSALDAETEREITAEIDALHGRKTLVIIAHRLSTVQHCDKLFFFDGGRLIDSGSFRDLIARNLRFRGIVETMQLSTAAAPRLGAISRNAIG